MKITKEGWELRSNLIEEISKKGVLHLNDTVNKYETSRKEIIELSKLSNCLLVPVTLDLNGTTFSNSRFATFEEFELPEGRYIGKENLLFALNTLKDFHNVPKMLFYLASDIMTCDSNMLTGFMDFNDLLPKQELMKVKIRKNEDYSNMAFLICNHKIKGLGGIVYSQTDLPNCIDQFNEEIYNSLNETNFWKNFNTNKVCIDSDLISTSVTHESLIDRHFAIAFVEVIEQLEKEKLEVFERIVFEFTKPKKIVLISNNAEFKKSYKHPFELTRTEFVKWTDKICKMYNYKVEISYTGKELENIGTSAQMAVFTYSI